MKNKIFKIKNSIEKRNIGSKFPQISNMKPGYDYISKNSVHSLSKCTTNLPDFTPDLDYFILPRASKLTDTLSVSVTNGGFLVSNRLKNLLNECILPMHAFYEAKVFYKHEIYNYYWIHLICNLTEYIDFEKSTFFIYVDYSKNLGYLQLASLNDYYNSVNSLKEKNPNKSVTVWSESLKFLPSFKLSFDLFKIGTFDSNYYVSEKLLSLLKTNNITGFDFEAADNLSVL